MILAAGAVVAIACMASAAPLHDAPDLMPVTMLAPPQHPLVELVRQGQPRAVVHVAAASSALKTLVTELIEAVRLSTGAELKVVAEPPAADQPAIVIGDCAESRQAGIDAAKLPIEGFAVKTAPARVYLVGSTAPLPPTGGGEPCRNEGTAWAVADFLERFVGVRWYWPAQFGGRSVVKSADLAVPPVHYVDAPAFRKRSHWPPFYDGWASRWTDKTQPPPPHAAGGTGRIEMGPLLACLRSGNSWPYLIQVHQPQWWPEDQWQAANAKYPTMFAVNADGTRSKTLLCYSSKDTLAYLLAGCAQTWDQGGVDSWVTPTCVTVSPADHALACECEVCLATMKSLRDQARAELADDPVGRQRFLYWTWTFDAFLADAGTMPPAR